MYGILYWKDIKKGVWKERQEHKQKLEVDRYKRTNEKEMKKIKKGKTTTAECFIMAVDLTTGNACSFLIKCSICITKAHYNKILLFHSRVWWLHEGKRIDLFWHRFVFLFPFYSILFFCKAYVCVCVSKSLAHSPMDTHSTRHI